MEYDWEQGKIRSTPILPSNHYLFISVGKYPRTGKKIRSNLTEVSAGMAGERDETEHLPFLPKHLWICPGIKCNTVFGSGYAEYIQLNIYSQLHSTYTVGRQKNSNWKVDCILPPSINLHNTMLFVRLMSALANQTDGANWTSYSVATLVPLKCSWTLSNVAFACSTWLF